MLKTTVCRYSTQAALATLLLSAAIAGCGAHPSDQAKGPEKVQTIGQIGAELTLGTVTVNRVHWTLKYLGTPAPTGWTGDRTDKFDVTGSGSTFTGLITGVPAVPTGAPAANGYDLTFNATSTDNTRVCSGHAMPTPFKVVGGQTVLQVVHLNCQDTRPKTGSILVNGDINACPTADGLSTDVLTQMVGGNITLTGMATDPDMAPMPLSYSFAVDPAAMQPAGHGNGTITSATPNGTGSATFRCDAGGPVSITMTVGDGDTQCTPDTLQVIVSCTGADACANTPACTATDQCHTVGVCNHVAGTPGAGQCSNPVKSDGSSCSDSDSCTQTDTCQAGVCTGGNPVVCSASDQCHTAGTCSPTGGGCSNPVAPTGTACNDNDPTTTGDACNANGVCAGTNPCTGNTCPVASSCQTGGGCNPTNGACIPLVNATNGTMCDDGSATTYYDQCTNGACGGSAYNCNPAFSCCSCESTTGTATSNCRGTSTLGDHLTGTTTTTTGGSRAPDSVCTLTHPCNASGTPNVVGGVSYASIFRAILDCFHSTGCAGDGFHETDCLCGIGADSNACFAGSVAATTGPCKDIIVQGADSISMTDISSRFTDPGFPIGAAAQMSENCDGLSCSSQCLGGNKQ